MHYRTLGTSAGIALALGMFSVMVSAGAEDAANTGSGQGKQVGFSVMGLSNAYNVTLSDLVQELGNKAGFAMVPTLDGQYKPTKQIDDISTLITSGVKGIFIEAIDGKAIKVALDRAEKAGIPVVGVDTGPDVNGGKVAMTVSISSVTLGERSCEELGKLMGGKGKALEIQGSFNNQVGVDRSVGFNNCMKQKYPGITVLSRQGEWQADKGSTITQTVLSTDPDVAGIYLASDSVYLPGVVAALQRAGRYARIGEEGHVPIVTIDGGTFAHEQVRKGYVDIVVGQPVVGYVQWGVQYMQAALEGKTFKPGPTDHGSEIIRRDDGNLVDILPPVIINKANVDDPNLWGNKTSQK